MNSKHKSPERIKEVVSERVIYPSRSGRKIVGYIDSPGEGAKKRPFVIMAPKYGETKKNNLFLAYYLAINGLSVLRFDHTSHVGESDGVMTEFTLESGVEDILASLDYLDKQFGANKVALLASSLSARSSIRAAAMDKRVTHLLCLVGVVNVQHTLNEVYREDLVANHISGKTWGVTDILGHEIDFDQFLNVAVAKDMHNLEGSRKDLASLTIPVSFYPAEKDVWVDIDEVNAVVPKGNNSGVFPISGAMHEVRESTGAADKVYLEVVSRIKSVAGITLGLKENLKVPHKRTVLSQNKVEREALRIANPIKHTENEFWTDYLEKYRMLDQVTDFREYMDLVGELLGPIKEGDLVLDAGCGNGMFGLSLVRRLIEQKREEWGKPALYVGVDLTAKGLGDAMEMHTDTQLAARNQPGLFADNSIAIQTFYTQMDLDKFGREGTSDDMVLFEDQMFDKICCSLLVSYLKLPLDFMKQLHRVLKPGGIIMISSMKPFCDMSLIYRDFMDEKVPESELDSARGLLRAAGAIKIKEEQGYYVFYSGDELSQMMQKAGFSQCSVFSSFGNQADIVRAIA
ncbi:MAG: methyltransferase domain-containing protein [Opitutaceae bacterium]|nr:methyltransferase domain-containing protein [Opitutaceae bacterium]